MSSRTPREILRAWFESGDEPTGEQFKILINSLFHPDEDDFESPVLMTQPGDLDKKKRTTRAEVNASLASRSLYEIGMEFYDTEAGKWYIINGGSADTAWTFIDRDAATEVLRNLYKPTYTAPTFTNLNMTPGGGIAEVGEEVYPTLSMANYNHNDRDENGVYLGGCVADKANPVVKVDGVTKVKDTDYTVSGDIITFIVPLKKTGLDEFNITVTLNYSAGSVKNDLAFGLPYPTGQIPAGSVTASVNLYFEYATWWITDVAVFPEANSLRGGTKSFSNTINAVWPQGDLVLMLAIRGSETLDSVIDNTDLPTPITMTLQADTTIEDADGSEYNCKYYAVVASQEFDNDRNIQIKKH